VLESKLLPNLLSLTLILLRKTKHQEHGTRCRHCHSPSQQVILLVQIKENISRSQVSRMTEMDILVLLLLIKEPEGERLRKSID